MTLIEEPPASDQADAPTSSRASTSDAPRGLRAYARELKPSVATGGAPAAPLLVLFLLNAIDELNTVAFGVLLPEIKNYFGVSLTAITTVTTVAALFVIIAAVPLGYLGDRWHRPRLLAGGIGIWGLFAGLTAFAGNLFVLGVARFGSGAAKSLDSAQQSLIADIYPQDRRAAVYSFHRLGNSLGQIIGPVLAGVLATALFWQVPFLLFGGLGLLAAILVLRRVPNPARGATERAALGLDPEAAAPPPSITESWRLARSVRTLRRIWYALPFLVGSAGGVAPLFSVYYDEIFDVSATGRGFIQAASEPFGVVGLLVGGIVGNRLLARDPGRVITMVGATCALASGSFLVAAVSPVLAIPVAVGWLVSFTFGITGPAMVTLMSLVIPARSRAFALSVSAVMVAPGLLFLPVAAAIADAFGVRAGIAAMGPVFLVGALILASGGASVRGDIRAAEAAAAAAQASRDSDADRLLVVRDLDVHYGQVQILFNVDLDIDRGEIVALLGTNGAGKSTVLNAIAGVVAPSNGAIFLGGEDITHLPDYEHVDKGVVLVPGGKAVFPTLSVTENLTLATWGIEAPTAEIDARIQQVYEYFPILRQRGDERAGDLSGGEQQMLALGQAFLTRPTLLMIDELSLGLAPAVVEQLLGIVRAIHAEGTTIVLVEQSVNVALTVADRAVFMEKGEVRFTGPTAELLQRTDILRSVLLAGSQAAVGGVAVARDPIDLETAEPILELRGIGKSFGGVRALDSVDLVLHEGEVLGIVGPNGAGKTTVFDVISGFIPPDQGQVLLLGEDVTDLGPDERARMGLQRSFQDAKLFPSLTVAENLAVALDQRIETRSALLAAARFPNVAKAEARTHKRVQRLIELIGLGAFSDKFLRELSTGTRRLVDLACVLAADPKVLLLDEPSSGVAQRETEELGPLLQRVRIETGCSILIIEHDMPLICSVSDELQAMVLGTPVVRGTPREVLDHPLVVESYLGTDMSVINRSGELA